MQRLYLKWFKVLLGVPRIQKRWIMVGADIVSIAFVVLLVSLLKFGWMWNWQHYLTWSLFPVALVINIPLFFYFGLYRTVVRHSDGRTIWKITKAVGISICTIFLFNELIEPQMIPRSTIITYGFAIFVVLSASRLLVRWSYHMAAGYRDMSHNAIVYGANDASTQLVHSMRGKGDIAPIAFIDTKEELHGCELMGLEIYSPDDLEYLIKEFNCSHVILCMPDAPRRDRMKILRSLEPYPVHVKQTSMELIDGKPLQHIVEVNIADLLGREIVPPDPQLLGQCIKDKVVMVTGAGGSIGSELCRQVIQQRPKCLIAYELSEFALYKIEREFRKRLQPEAFEAHFIPILGSILDENRLHHVMNRFGVETIYHAAAYKHVPIVEHNVSVGVRNNILGTELLTRVACHHEVETFVLISTDKAVRPTNVMGATKRAAELVLQAYSETSCKTRFCMVRFGNVLGSSGSVVPLFREQIKKGGPVTVTHPEVTRYFMTIPEAAGLVLQAGSMGKGGDVFLLDMGESVKIKDLAERMIRLMGLTVRDQDNPEGDIPVNFIGLRPGEKLYEELLIGENVEGTEHPMIMKSKEHHWPKRKLEDVLSSLYQAVEKNDEKRIKTLLHKLVEGYVPSEENNDFIDRRVREEKRNFQLTTQSFIVDDNLLQ